MAEVQASLKAKRGTVKGQLTKTMSAINELLTDPANADLVNKKLAELDKHTESFSVVCQEHYNTLATDIERAAAIEYKQLVEEELQHIQDAVGAWLSEIAKPVPEVVASETEEAAQNDAAALEAQLQAEKEEVMAEMAALRKAREELADLRRQVQVEAQNVKQIPFTGATHSTPYRTQELPEYQPSRLSWPPPAEPTGLHELKEAFGHMLNDSRLHTQ